MTITSIPVAHEVRTENGVEWIIGGLPCGHTYRRKPTDNLKELEACPICAAQASERPIDLPSERTRSWFEREARSNRPAVSSVSSPKNSDDNDDEDS